MGALEVFMQRYLVMIWTEVGDEHYFDIDVADHREARGRARILAAGLEFELRDESGQLIERGPTETLQVPSDASGAVL